MITEYEVLWESENGLWTIEEMRGANVVNQTQFMVVDQEEGTVQYPIYYGNGDFGFDNPYLLPTYVKNKVKELLPIWWKKNR